MIERVTTMNDTHLSAVKNNLLNLDATELAKRIKTRRVSSEEVTETFIRHIEAVNPELNAVVEDRFELALAEAREKDQQISQVNLNEYPLYGVPISIKESFHVQGMKTTGGIVHRKDIIMSYDAEPVERLKKAGAIILCKTNTPSLCFCHETDNKLYGRTNNAWDKKRTAGGSSGGEASLIGVGGAPAGLSSDIGGSIRLPSHFNGVVGFKPGKFQVSTSGHFPPETHPLKEQMSSIGPMGKSVRDAELLYNVITVNNEQKAYYKRLQVDILPPDNGYPISTFTETILYDIYDTLKQTYDTDYSIPPYFHDCATIWQEIMSIDGAKDIRNLAFPQDRVNLWKYYTQEKLARNTNVHEYLSWALIGAKMFKPSKKRVQEIKTFIRENEANVYSYLSNRLLIMPVYYRGAHKHGEMYKEIFSIKKTYRQYMPYIAYANVWGLPSLTVPISFNNDGLPIGIQIISSIGNEQAIFTLGKQLEERFGGYKRSTVYD